MKIAVASGKGGTGKTTVAVNLALSLNNIQLLDCDVEEPDCQHFLGLDLEDDEVVESFLPLISEEKCDLCGKCAELCAWNAIVVTPQKALVFSELCSGCALCKHVCPREAILEGGKVLGKIQGGRNNVEFYQGVLAIGEPFSSPVIRAVKKKSKENKNTIIDAPPGNGCPAVTAVEDTDFCILVTEPTPFGLHDLKFSIRMINELEIPYAVIINRAGIGDNKVEKYCDREEIPILMTIPYDRKIAHLYSQGIPFVKEMSRWKDKFVALYDKITEMIP
ncbi:(4Fe-4S)-binding protein [candidate division MSBL1 archaeon SCGC-AAA261D19]|uniref:(4Fe-4S)-binding protein n=1 Tax=candidate division MSBL1 archaeon SCGC-AAA261D19 TaxID=1698273 RepID=A0A133V3W0_9EURY|nr:(4Fe-4S)-binding protein [candidate division MSBL1 archaeon SCGC-AAA261D19]